MPQVTLRHVHGVLVTGTSWLGSRDDDIGRRRVPRHRCATAAPPRTGRIPPPRAHPACARDPPPFVDTPVPFHRTPVSPIPAPFGSTGVRFLPPVRTRRTRRMRGPETRTRTYCGLGPTADSDVLHTRTYGERPRRRLDRPRSQVLTQSRLPTRSRPRSIEYGRDDTRQQRRRDSGHRDDSRRSGVAPPPPTEVPTSVRTRDSRDRNATSETGKPRAEATGPVLGSTRRSTFVIRRLPPDDSVGPCECGQDRWVRAVCGGGGRKWCARRSELAREATG